MKWVPDNKFLAAETHFLLGFSFIMAPLALHLWSNMWFGLLAVLVVDVPKEFLFDRLVEGQSPAAGLVDLMWWLVGSAVALLLLAILLSG